MSKSPDAFRTISEVAEWLDTPAHVLRFWESKFPQVKPVKRAGGRRYYRPADMALLGGIKQLLHDDGLTIKGVQKMLSEQGVRSISELAPPLDEDPGADGHGDIIDALDAEGSPVPARIEDAPDAAPLAPETPAATELETPTAGPADIAPGEAPGSDPARGPATASGPEGDTPEPVAPDTPQQDEVIAEAPFIEAEAPTSTVVPFTGSGLSETPDGNADDDTDTDDAEIAQPPLTEAPTEATPEFHADASPDTTDSPADGDDTMMAEIVEAMEDKRSAESADATPDTAPIPEADTPAAADVGNEDAPQRAPDPEDADQPSLFGTTPEFLAKPFSDRADGPAGPSGQDTTDADPDVDPADAVTPAPEPEQMRDADPEPGPLHYLATLDRLSAQEAAALAPLVQRLQSAMGGAP